MGTVAPGGARPPSPLSSPAADVPPRPPLPWGRSSCRWAAGGRRGRLQRLSNGSHRRVYSLPSNPGRARAAGRQGGDLQHVTSRSAAWRASRVPPPSSGGPGVGKINQQVSQTSAVTNALPRRLSKATDGHGERSRENANCSQRLGSPEPGDGGLCDAGGLSGKHPARSASGFRTAWPDALLLPSVSPPSKGHVSDKNPKSEQTLAWGWRRGWVKGRHIVLST